MIYDKYKYMHYININIHKFYFQKIYSGYSKDKVLEILKILTAGKAFG